MVGLMNALRRAVKLQPSLRVFAVLALATTAGEIAKLVGPGLALRRKNPSMEIDAMAGILWPTGGLASVLVLGLLSTRLGLHRLVTHNDVAKMSELFSTSAIFVLLLEDFVLSCWTPPSLAGCVEEPSFVNAMFDCGAGTTVLGTDCTEEQVDIACDRCYDGYVTPFGYLAYVEIAFGVVSMLMFDDFEESTHGVSRTFFQVTLFVISLTSNLMWSVFLYSYSETARPGIQPDTVSFVATSRLIVQGVIMASVFHDYEKVSSSGSAKIAPAATPIQSWESCSRAEVDDLLAAADPVARGVYTRVFAQMDERRAALEREWRDHADALRGLT